MTPDHDILFKALRAVRRALEGFWCSGFGLVLVSGWFCSMSGWCRVAASTKKRDLEFHNAKSIKFIIISKRSFENEYFPVTRISKRACKTKLASDIAFQKVHDKRNIR